MNNEYTGPPATTPPPPVDDAEWSVLDPSGETQRPNDAQAVWNVRHRQTRQRRRRFFSALITGIGIGVAVTILATRSDTPTNPLSGLKKVALPSAVDGFTQDQQASSITTAVGTGSQLYGLRQAAAAAQYGTAAHPDSITIIAVPAAAIAKLAIPQNQRSPVTIAAALIPFTPLPASYPPGPHVGALSCAQDRNATTTTTYCNWCDASTFGLIRTSGPALPLARLATTTNDLRALVDH